MAHPFILLGILVSLEALKVTCAREREAIAGPFFDVRIRRILLASMRKARTMEELSRLSGIPLGSCYRKVHALVRGHLLRVSSFVLTPEGKKLALYRCGFDKVSVSLKSSGFSLEVTPHRCLSVPTRRAPEISFAP